MNARGFSQLLAILSGDRREYAVFNLADNNHPMLVVEGKAKLIGTVVQTALSAHALPIYDGTLVAAVPATLALGEFTAGAGGDTDSQLALEFDDSDSHVLTVTSTPAGASLAAAAMAAGFVAAGFAADGSGSVLGYTLDLGGAATITAAITAGSLTVVREDGVDFAYAEDPEVGTVYGGTVPTFADAVASEPSTDGEPATIDESTQVAGLPASAGAGTTWDALGVVCNDGIFINPNDAATGVVTIIYERLPTY